MDTGRVTEFGKWVTKVDLTKVDEVGWADLMAGGMPNGGCADAVATTEVYGKPVSRDANNQN